MYLILHNAHLSRDVHSQISKASFQELLIADSKALNHRDAYKTLYVCKETGKQNLTQIESQNHRIGELQRYIRWQWWCTKISAKDIPTTPYVYPDISDFA